jgi:divalent metal cation (Fe/Co/Zn/Cd) transporter
MSTTVDVLRQQAVRRGQWLTWATLVYNSLEGIIAIAAGILAGSIALLGFGVDSFIEVSASVAAIWRLSSDLDRERRAIAERRSLRIIGISFFGLAAYIGVEATRSFLGGSPPEASPVGIALAAISIVIMPLLANAKRRVAAQLSSHALRAEARQTDICMYLSVILLAGLALNALFGWWWADPLAGLLMVPLIAWEGRDALRGRAVCDDCSPTSPPLQKPSTTPTKRL